jgi:galactose-1-phosphate uridylyltransferase
MSASNDFKPQDFSRFLIREFLKKNGFDKTYDQFMLEDNRPKVTMTKNELMRLLGIESLMKKNTKSKQFETMLDIICDSLVSQKSNDNNPTTTTTDHDTTTTTTTSSIVSTQ